MPIAIPSPVKQPKITDPGILIPWVPLREVSLPPVRSVRRYDPAMGPATPPRAADGAALVDTITRVWVPPRPDVEDTPTKGLRKRVWFPALRRSLPFLEDAPAVADPTEMAAAPRCVEANAATVKTLSTPTGPTTYAFRLRHSAVAAIAALASPMRVYCTVASSSADSRDGATSAGAEPVPPAPLVPTSSVATDNVHQTTTVRADSRLQRDTHIPGPSGQHRPPLRVQYTPPTRRSSRRVLARPRPRVARRAHTNTQRDQEGERPDRRPASPPPTNGSVEDRRLHRTKADRTMTTTTSESVVPSKAAARSSASPRWCHNGAQRGARQEDVSPPRPATPSSGVKTILLMEARSLSEETSSTDLQAGQGLTSPTVPGGSQPLVAPNIAATTHCHCHHQSIAAVELPTFAGTLEEDAILFFQRFDEYVASQRVTSDRLNATFTSSMTGDAASWWAKYVKYNLNMPFVKKRFIARFAGADTQSALRAHFFGEAQRATEAGQSFLLRKRQLWQRLLPADILEERAVAASVSVMRPHYQQAISLGRPSTYLDATDTALDIDLALAKTAPATSAPAPRAAAPQKAAPVAPPLVPWCNHCKTVRHYHRDCPQLQARQRRRPTGRFNGNASRPMSGNANAGRSEAPERRPAQFR